MPELTCKQWLLSNAMNSSPGLLSAILSLPAVRQTTLLTLMESSLLCLPSMAHNMQGLHGKVLFSKGMLGTALA